MRASESECVMAKRQKNQDCGHKVKYTTTKFVADFLGIVYRVSKSIIFNILLFIIGFGLGYVVVTNEVHYCAVQHDEAEYLQKIQSCIQKLEKTYDDTCMPTYNEMLKTVEDLQKQQAHEVKIEKGFPLNCESELGKRIFKK